MEDLAVSTVVRLPPEEVYEFLFDFTRYSEYSRHVDDVRVRGDGKGTRFRIGLSWWKLDYTVRGVVTGVDPPNRIEWSITRDVDASGYWSIEPLDGDRLAAECGDCEAASVARLYLEFDPATIGSRTIGLPPGISFGWVLDRIRPVAKREAEKIAARAVEDVEGARRPVEVTVESSPADF